MQEYLKGLSWQDRIRIISECLERMKSTLSDEELQVHIPAQSLLKRLRKQNEYFDYLKPKHLSRFLASRHLYFYYLNGLVNQFLPAYNRPIKIRMYRFVSMENIVDIRAELRDEIEVWDFRYLAPYPFVELTPPYRIYRSVMHAMEFFPEATHKDIVDALWGVKKITGVEFRYIFPHKNWVYSTRGVSYDLMRPGHYPPELKRKVAAWTHVIGKGDGKWRP